MEGRIGALTWCELVAVPVPHQLDHGVDPRRAEVAGAEEESLADERGEDSQRWHDEQPPARADEEHGAHRAHQTEDQSAGLVGVGARHGLLHTT